MKTGVIHVLSFALWMLIPLPKWSSRLADSETYLRDNCWAMMEAHVVQLAPPEH